MYVNLFIFVFVGGMLVPRVHSQEVAQGNGRGEANDKKAPRVDDGSLITYQRVPHPRREEDRSRAGVGVSREALRERLDSVVLLLSRLSDRVVAMQTNQAHENERIDNINYRITKLDLQNQESKNQFTEVWTNLRHRLQTSDREMQSISDVLDDLKTDTTAIGTNAIEIKAKMDNLKERNFDTSRSGGPKLQAILAAIFGVKSTTEVIRKNVLEIAQNLTNLANNTKSLEILRSSLVSKEDFHLGLAGIKEGVSHSMPFFPYTLTTNKNERNRKSESNDCWELLHKRGKTKSGVYRINPPLSPTSFFVYCDMETEGGGWTVIQRREDGTVDFKRDWKDYKYGFGNLAGEFWMGNDKIYQMTNEHVNELRIHLTDFSQTMVTASYTAFAIGPESEGYALRLLSAYSGDAGDSLIYHVGQKWSTFDLDNDAWPAQNCAREHTGAWWYKACETSNLNGMYLHGPVPPGDEYKGIYWYDFHGPRYSLWQTTMMIRRGGAVSRRNATMPPRVEHSPNLPHPLENAVNPAEENPHSY